MDSGETAIDSSFCAIFLALSPASTRIRVDAVSTSAQFPELPLARTER